MCTSTQLRQISHHERGTHCTQLSAGTWSRSCTKAYTCVCVCQRYLRMLALWSLNWPSTGLRVCCLSLYRSSYPKFDDSSFVSTQLLHGIRLEGQQACSNPRWGRWNLMTAASYLHSCSTASGLKVNRHAQIQGEADGEPCKRQRVPTAL